MTTVDQPNATEESGTAAEPGTAGEPTQAPSGGLLTPSEVAVMFRVDPKTVTRWAVAGRIGSIRTPGGHRRFYESEVRELLARHAVIPMPTDGEAS